MIKSPIQKVTENLQNRAIGIIASITGLDFENSKLMLSESNNCVKNAIVMHKLQVNFQESEKILGRYQGSLRKAIDAKK